MNAITALLVDVDGTLIQSNDQHARAWSDAFAEAGRPVPPERFRPLIGMGADRVLPAIDPALSEESEPGKTMARRQGEIVLERYLDDIEPLPGARELCADLDRRGIRIVVASSSKPKALRALLGRASLERLADCATDADKAEASKPAPSLIEQALAVAGVTADRALMLGDTPYDIEAATRAGVGSIGLESGGWQAQDLHGARAVYADPAALLADLDAVLAGAPSAEAKL